MSDIYWGNGRTMKDSYKDSVGTYTAPTAGYYQVSALVVKYVPTGRMITRENEDRKWYQFWKPRFVTVPEFIQKETMEGSEIKFLNAGDSVKTKRIVRL